MALALSRAFHIWKTIEIQVYEVQVDFLVYFNSIIYKIENIKKMKKQKRKENKFKHKN